MSDNMSNNPRTLSFAPDQDREELARAELYGLLAGLWLAPPDAALLQQFKVAVTEAPQPGGHLEAPWGELVAAMRATDLAAAAAEHQALFHAVGRPEVLAYASFHLSGFLNERPLALLRDDLARLGLTRDADGLETEDHIAFLFEVMRWLIAGDDGLDVLRPLVLAAAQSDARLLALDLGAGQASAVSELISAAGFSGVTAHSDLAGIERVVVGER